MLYKINIKPLPDVRVWGQITYEKGWTNHGGVRRRNMMLYIVFGAMRVDMGGMSMDLLPGDYLIIPSGTFFTATLTERSCYRYCHFSPPGIITLSNEDEMINEDSLFAKEQNQFRYTERTAHTTGFVFVKHTGSITKYSGQVEKLMRQIDKYRLESNPIAKQRLDLAFTELLLLFNEDARGEVVTTERLSPAMSDMLLWISKNYAEKITLDDMSRRFGFSKQHIIRLFKAHCNQSVIQYVNSFRLLKSLDLLRNTDIPVGDIARSLGFSSAYYFNRIYKRTYGVTPSEYRKSQNRG